MKIISALTLFLGIIVFITACNSEKNADKAEINALNIQNYNFDDTDIIYEVLSKKGEYIKNIRILLKIDDRLKNLSDISDIKGIDIKIGDKEKIKISDFSEDAKIYKKEDILIIDLDHLDLSSSQFKNIDIIAVNFFLENTNKKVIGNTDPFYYKNSVQLLGLENTFMDTPAFKKAEVLIKKDSIQNNYLAEIGVTIKTKNQDIDDIKNIQLDLWSDKQVHTLDFVHSIYEGAVIEKNESKKCTFLGFNRPGKDYIYYHFNILPLKLKEIDSLKIKLEDKLYYSNKLTE